MDNFLRAPRIDALYERLLREQRTAPFLHAVERHYTLGTLERLAVHGQRLSRRAAVLAIGHLGDYTLNATLGRALTDRDRGVRTLAESGIRVLWCRVGDALQRRRLGFVIRLNGVHRYDEAVRHANTLIDAVPWLAEAWNQRALAHFNLGRFDDSILDCRQTLDLNPFHFGAATGMGQCFLRLNDRAAALDSFRRALKVNPGLEGVRAHVVYLQRALENSE